MFRITWLITFDPALSDDAKNAEIARYDELASNLAELRHLRNRPSLEGSFNGGDIVSHMVFDADADWPVIQASWEWEQIEAFGRQSTVVRCDWVAYRQQETGLRDPSITGGIHRILMLSVIPDTPPEKTAQFEKEMCAMPHYLASIRNWCFSRVIASGGARPWTHVWEQDFISAQDLFGPYMMHPIHFASIDRWFDPQSPDWIVDPDLCSTYCLFDQSALAQTTNSCT